MNLNDEQRRTVADGGGLPLTLVGEGGRDYALLPLSEYARIVAESANRRDVADSQLGGKTSSVRREIVPSRDYCSAGKPLGQASASPVTCCQLTTSK